MKTKKASKTNASSRIIFFAIALIYNLLLGFYLKDFLALSPMLLTFYLLSALPALFLLMDVRSKSMRAVIFVTLFLILLMDLAYMLNCRRVILFPTAISLMFEVLYFGAFVRGPRKDSFVTKIGVLAVTALIATTLLSTYNFVCKLETPYLSNGKDTLWDTQTEELADKICAGCESDSEKAQAFHNWIVANFEYDYDCDPLIQYFDVRKTLRSQKSLCFDFSICSPRSAVVRTFLAMSLMEHPIPKAQTAILGIAFTMTEFGGMWISHVIFYALRTIRNYTVFEHWKTFLLLINTTT